MTVLYTDARNEGTPQTGLSPTVTIKDSSGTAIVTAAVMGDIGDGGYSYTVSDSLLGDKEYMAFVDLGVTILDPAERYQRGPLCKFTNTTSGGGGGSTKIIAKLDAQNKTFQREFKKILEEMIKEEFKSMNLGGLVTLIEGNLSTTFTNSSSEQAKAIKSLQSLFKKGFKDYKAIAESLASEINSTQNQLISGAVVDREKLTKLFNDKSTGMNKELKGVLKTFSQRSGEIENRINDFENDISDVLEFVVKMMNKNMDEEAEKLLQEKLKQLSQ